MGKTACRYTISAIGKGGEMYYTYCRDKQELKKWIADNQDKLSTHELKITDKYKKTFLTWFSLKN
ncbi:hypothetical protein [Pseudobacillus badius]|uniref:hypothetical protein n=1 Tax=Bacillus badius TaxID=1455 RepID=UPI003D356B7A